MTDVPEFPWLKAPTHRNPTMEAPNENAYGSLPPSGDPKHLGADTFTELVYA
jgi:hypothetical protein